MDTLKIYFEGIAPLSTNQTKSFNSKGQYFKNKKKQKFQQEMNAQLLKFKKDCWDFEAAFNKKEEYLTVSYYWYFPEHIFFTKKGKLSLTRTDWDNTIKAFQDSIFKQLRLNDSFILDAFVQLRPAKDFKCVVHITKMLCDF